MVKLFGVVAPKLRAWSSKSKSIEGHIWKIELFDVFDVLVSKKISSKSWSKAVFPNLFCSRHPYLVFKAFGGTPG